MSSFCGQISIKYKIKIGDLAQLNFRGTGENVTTL